MMETKLRFKRIEYICYISFLVSFILLVLKAFKGFIWHDECFYLSTANRFVLGDRVLIDEWNSAQFFAVLLMPLVWLYRTITGGTEGIILAFRIAYIIFSGAISGYMFAVLKRRNNLWTAFVAAVLNLYYVKLGIAAFSYNTIALEMLLLSGMLIYDWLEKKQKRKVIFSGTAYAMATLSNPFLVMGQLLIVLGILFYGIRHREHGKSVRNAYLYHVLGILMIAVPVFVWWIKDITFYEFSTSVRCLLRNSSAASEKGTFHRMLSFGWQIVKLYKVTILPYAVLLVLSMKYAVQKKKNPQFLNVNLLLQTVIFYINIFLSGSGMNIGVSLIAVTMYGANLFFLLTEDKRNKSLYWFILGGVSAFLFFISSDTGVPSIASGCLISSIGTFVCMSEITDCVQNIEKRWQIALKIFAFGAIAAVVVSTITFRFVYVFRDGRIEDLNYKIESGPAKGLYTHLARKQDYDLVLQAVNDYVSEEDCLLVTKLAPWAYLCTDAACGSYSTWITRYDSEVLEEYYLLFPNRIPNKILILNEEIGYKNEDNPRGGYLEKLVGEYEEKKLGCGVLLTHERF